MIELDVPGKTFNGFIETKEYKRFHEFADSVIEYRYIGICHGEAGIGKSLAASYYSRWQDKIYEQALIENISEEMKKVIKNCKAILITAPVTNTPRIIGHEFMRRITGYGHSFRKALDETDIIKIISNSENECKLVIIDEADRLSITSLEEVRSLYDRFQFGVIFIGMPGIEKRFSRYPQLYSRLGFRHEYKKLSEDEMRFLFPKIWGNLGTTYNPEVFSDVEAMNTIIKITSGNFRLIDRLFSQIKRILTINKLNQISKEVVDAARRCLIIGDPE